MRTRSQGYEPPPPPPPPLPEVRRRASDEASSSTSVRDRWILKVRSPPPNRSVEREYFLPSIIKMEITPRMSASILSDCLQHALRMGDGNNLLCGNKLAGLFVEELGLFRSLQDIVQGHPTPQYTYTVFVRPPPPKELPWWSHVSTVWLVLFLVTILPFSTLCVRIYNHSETIITFTTEFLIWMYKSAVQIPLADLYRHAPLIGWQGYRDKPHICARLTHYGDADFWARNLDDCLRIYHDAETSFLSIARPAVHGLVFTLLLWIVWSVAHAWLVEQRRQAHRGHPPPDRDMVETYRALQILLRQVKRNWADPSKQETSSR